jgi:hypothetical protein
MADGSIARTFCEQALSAARQLRPGRGWAFELSALALALLLALGGLALIPGSWLLDVEPIEILQDPGGEPFVVHRATLHLPTDTVVTYAAEVREIDSSLGPAPQDLVMCRGVSRWYLPPMQTTEVRITLRAWVDDHDCRLRRGRSYYATVTYYFDLFFFSKTVTLRTSAVAIPIVRMLVGPTVPPGL